MNESKDRFTGPIQKVNLTPEESERFWSKVKKTKGCWKWTAKLDKNGYGHFRWRGKNRGAHGMSFAIKEGVFRVGIPACHSCDNRSCVNPNHLWRGTQSENNKDMVNKGRNAKGEQVGTSIMKSRDVLKIRTMQGTMSHRKIASLFGVARCTVSVIIARKAWKHI